MNRIAKPHGLTAARFMMLTAIGTSSAYYQRDLWRIFDVSRTTVSRIVRALERLGFIERKRVRGVASIKLEATKKGREVLDSQRPDCERMMSRVIELPFTSLRSRIARAFATRKLHETLTTFARALGDRSQCLWVYENEWTFPDPAFWKSIDWY